MIFNAISFLPSLVAGIILAAFTGTLRRAQQQVTIGASKDNTLSEESSCALSDGAGQHFFAVKTSSGAIRRALLVFDFSGNIPHGATILSATLTLNLSLQRRKNYRSSGDLVCHRDLLSRHSGTPTMNVERSLIESQL